MYLAYGRGGQPGEATRTGRCPRGALQGDEFEFLLHLLESIDQHLLVDIQ